MSYEKTTIAECKKEASIALARLLVNAVTCYRKGGEVLLVKMGFDREVLVNLEQLRPNQLTHIVDRYTDKLDTKTIFKINRERIEELVGERLQYTDSRSQYQKTSYTIRKEGVEAKIRSAAEEDLVILLMRVLDLSEQGMPGLAEEMGFDLDALRGLMQLNVEQLKRLAESYMCMESLLNMFNIDFRTLSCLVRRGLSLKGEGQMEEEFIMRGATNGMMRRLFGTHKLAAAHKRRLFGVNAKVEKRLVDDDVFRRIQKSWNANYKGGRDKDLYLTVANESNSSLREVEIAEKYIVEKLTESQANCAHG